MSSDSDELQRAHLAQVTSWAERAREELEPLAREHRGKVHFRPSSGGVALVGLLPSRPQRGRSGFRDLAGLARNFDPLFQQHCVDTPQGRPTPEKQLQSWMTADAYRHGRQMRALDDAAGDGAKTLFVGDELALPVGDGRRIVCDLLALRRGPGDRQVPAVIELKSARQLRRLVEQVRGYAASVDRQKGAFEALFSAVLGETVSFDGPAEQWIVWPQAGAAEDPRSEQLAAEGIRVVGYQESDGEFSFRVGRRP